ncbi:MAG TPA: dTMP kinase [Coxiellaceae bacterium]|nr:dTMP kinase [Coxiellaceae bacterium]
MKTGKFISLEGVEGMGKSTALSFIEKELRHHNISFIRTREPGGTPVAEQIRHILLAQHEETLCANTELLLMFAARVQNIEHVIKPALAQGQWVISDRYTDASFAYQGGGRGVPVEKIVQLAQWIQADVVPDLTLLLDAPVDIGLERIKARKEKDRIESEDVEFFIRVRSAYLELAHKNPQRYRVIAAHRPLAEVQQQIRIALDELGL